MVKDDGRAVLARQLGRRSHLIAGLILLQTLAAVFFFADVAGELGLPQDWASTINVHTGTEAVVSLVLALGIGFSAVEMRRTLERQQRAETAVSIAAGAFAGVLDSFFTTWQLTPAEREVALMTLKGLENEAIAEVRGVAVGTVRAQTARIYAKAGVSSRAQLMSIFIEELLAEPLAPGLGRLPAD